MSKNEKECEKNKNENTRLREPADVNFCGLSASASKTAEPIGKVSKFYTSEAVKKCLSYANKNQLVFSAAFALILTCVLRPASIMTLPGQKKNKDDKLYASAHSIASGIIGFGITTAIATPFSRAMNKIKANPSKYIDKNSYLAKNKQPYEYMIKYFDRIPDIVFAVPKGMLTIVLIPPILKHVFGWEKKVKKSKQKEIPQIKEIPPLHFKNKTENVEGGNK